jgi:tRNA pseudouridine55 synthase
MPFLLINKPIGPTSHDIVNRLRKITGIKKIGHAGTLDPFAEGLLLVAIGRESTRKISQFVGLDKKYLATLKLGAVSDTEDRTGKISIRHPERSDGILTKEKIEKTLKKFLGKQEQIPPMFSAKQIDGKRLYKLARQGKEIERPTQQIEIYEIKLKKYLPKKMELILEIKCSSGTYIRTLAHDLGQTLGCGAYLEKLVRTEIGKYKIKKAILLEKLTSKNWGKYCF